MYTGGSSNISNSEKHTNCTSAGGPHTICIQPWYLFAGVVATVTCLFGIPANISVIVKLSRHLRGSTMSQRLFFNLAMSDLLCLFCLLAGGFIFLTELHSTLRVCQVLFYLFFFSVTSSLHILVLISIQRYYQVCN